MIRLQIYEARTKFKDELTMTFTKPEDWAELHDLVYGCIPTAPLALRMPAVPPGVR